MPKHLKFLFFLSLLSATACLKAQPGILNIHPDSIGEDWKKPLRGWALWEKTFPPYMGISEIAKQRYELLEESAINIEKGANNLWFKFSLHNPSASDSLQLFLTFDTYIQKASLYHENDGGWKKYLAGRHNNYEELAFSDNAFAFPISIPPDSSVRYFLNLQKKTNKKTDSINPAILVSPEMEAKNRIATSALDFGLRSFNSFFLGAILIFALFTLVYFIGKKDKAYLFYSLYLFCLFIFYFKNFEVENRSLLAFSLFAKWFSNVETLATYASFVFYMQFIRYFLDIREADIKLDWLLVYSSWFFMSLLPIDIVVQMTLGTSSSVRLLEIIYLPFFLFSFYILWSLWRKRLSLYSKFIIIGTILLLMGIVPFRLAQVIGIRYDDFAWGTLRAFFFQSGDFYWYHTKLGLLMEIACFMIGLAWKTQQEGLEMARLANRIRVMERLARPPSQSEETVVSSQQVKPISDEGGFLKKANAIIEEKYTDNTFLPSHLAARLHISYSHCAHLVKQKTGLSISLYIQQFRLQKAKELLRTTDLPIKQVAYQSGFNNPSYFSRLFKEVMGTSPSDYRSNGHFTEKK